MTKNWSASDARANFASLLNEAAEGHIQTIERRDGTEFVLVSKEMFMTSRPGLAAHLAELDTGLSARDSDEWLQVMRDVQGKD